MDLQSFGEGAVLNAQPRDMGSREQALPPVINALDRGQFASTKLVPTDFSSWTEEELVSFLKRRGEDYDDCIDIFALQARASLCEMNTGQKATKIDLIESQGGDDELEAFMAGIERDIKNSEAKKKENVTEGCDVDNSIDEYIQAHEKSKLKERKEIAGDGEFGDDSDALGTDDKNIREVVPLDEVDHSKINYCPFTKNLYDESPDVFALDDEEVAELRREMQVEVQGREVPKLVSSFEQCGFPSKLMATIQKAGFTKPTSVQSQVLPVAMSGRDVVGVAQTGSGKTAAFLLPMAIHVSVQSRARPGQGPIAIIIAPTRELAEQIHREACRLMKPFNFRVCAAFGGLQKHAQKRELQGGVEVAVATPGRLIDLVRSIVEATRPDRQTLLFSATLPQRVKRLVREALTDEVSVTVGIIGAAHADVKQDILLMPSTDAKMQWLQARITSLVDEGQVVLFVNARASVDAVVTLLQGSNIKAGGLHGDMDQFSRMAVLSSFKSNTIHVLVATDVAARGLDVRSVKAVVNFDVARTFEAHVHRIGRTGRAGDTGGHAITLIMPQETRMAASITESLQAARQNVPKNLHDLAMKDPAFRKSSGAARRGPRASVGGAGLGFAEQQRGNTAALHSAFTPAATSGGGADVGASTHPTAPTTAAGAQPFHPPSTQGGLPPPPPLPFQTAPLAGGPPVGEKRPPPPLVDPSATSKAPKGFVKSSVTVGGDFEGPQIVLPTTKAQAEAPAAWLQKRIQEKRGGGMIAPPVVSRASAPLDSEGIAQAIAKAKEAAARLMGSSDSVQHTQARQTMPTGGYGAREPPGMSQTSHHPHPGPQCEFSPASSRSGPRMTPEEARKIAQQAALRASANAAQNNSDAWKWSKT